MSSQKLSPADRKEAKQMIIDHFRKMRHPVPSIEEAVAVKFEEIETKNKKLIAELKTARAKVDSLLDRLERKMPRHFSAKRNGVIEVGYSSKKTVASPTIRKALDKNKPIVAKEKKALAKLQTTETREGLAKIYKSLGIL